MTGPQATTGPPPRLIVVLVLATALGPFAMQVFLPALPAIQAGFGVSAATAQLSFSLSAFAIAVSTLFYGPLSDRLGRRPALLGGLVIYLLGSLLCAAAPSISLLILGRIVQAAGGCAGLVLCRAIIRDLYSLDRSAAVLAYVTMAMVAAPMVAPVLGGLLVDMAGWRSVFLAGAAVGVAILVAVHGGLPETAARADAPRSANPLHGVGRLLRSPAFMGYALQSAFSIAVFYAFLASAPFLMLIVLRRPASEYGLLFILISGAFMVGNFIAGRYSARIGSDRMILLGSLGSLAATLLTLAPLLAGTASGPGGFLQVGLAAPMAVRFRPVRRKSQPPRRSYIY